MYRISRDGRLDYPNHKDTFYHTSHTQPHTTSDCPAILPANPHNDEPYVLHVNLPTAIRPPLILRATDLSFLQEQFDSGLFQCVVCTGKCIGGDDIIFNLLAQLMEDGSGVLNQIQCGGETVRIIKMCRDYLHVY